MRRNLLLAAALAAIAVGCNGPGAPPATSGAASQNPKGSAEAASSAKPKITAENVPELTVDEVEKGIADKSLHVFDANPKDVWAEGHVPGAEWVPFNGVRTSMLPEDTNAKLVFYCANEH